MESVEDHLSPKKPGTVSALWARYQPENATLSGLFGVGFLLFILSLFLLSTYFQGFGYDLVPYLGAVFEADGQTAGEAHRLAWQTVKQAAPGGDYTALASADAYRQRQSSDAAAFHSVLPFYAVKIGYIYWLQALGNAIGWLKAAMWTSHINGLLLGLFALFWMWKQRFLQAAPLLAGVLLLTDYFNAMRYPGPDIIAAFLCLAGAYLWLRKREIPALALFFPAFLCRPDTLLFVFALLLASAAWRLPVGKLAVAFLLFLLCSVAMQKAVHHPGWWVHYYFSCVEIQPTLEGFHPPFSLLACIKGLARGVYMSITDFNWPVLLVFAGFFATVLARGKYVFAPRQRAMLAACVLATGGKFIVFPLPDDRIYMPVILIITMVLFEIWQPRLGTKA